MATGEIKLLTMGGEKFDVSEISKADKEERRLDVVCVLPNPIHTIDMEISFDDEGNQSCETKIQRLFDGVPITEEQKRMMGYHRIPEQFAEHFLKPLFIEVYSKFMVHYYRDAGRRIPGSLRTKRLRKKRAKALGILNAR